MPNETNKPPIRALISGGASGLGFASAQHIIEQGGQVVILDNNQEKGLTAQQSLGRNAQFVQADVGDFNSVEHAVKQAVEELGHINLNLNCAGVAPSQRVLGRDGLMAMEDYIRVIEINLSGTFALCRACANEMQHNPVVQDGERGVIINTASIAAFDGQIGQAHYAASKGGIASMTLPLAREFARFGIRVMTIAPGLFRTPLFDRLPEKAVNALEEATPFPKRLGMPNEFAALVDHIYINTMLNGEIIRLDGALRMS